MKKILITGPFKYPDKDAGGKRVRILKNMLSKYADVDVTCWDVEGDISNLQCKDREIITNDFYGVGKSKISRAFHYLLLGRKTLSKFKFNFSIYNVIILYNPPFLFSLCMYFLSKFQGFSVVIESNEWYESEHLPGGKYGLASLENFSRMKFSYLLFDKFIVMSDFMYNYYSYHKKQVYKIPPIASSFSTKHRDVNSISECLHLMYAGSPGKKDRVNEIFDGYLSLSDEYKSKVKISFLGFTFDEFLSMYPKYSTANKFKNVVFLGRKSMDFVESYYAQVDYTIFLRENKRYAKAGFPSKFVESLSYDTPVITNCVGDVSYFIDKVGLAFNPSIDDFNKVVEVALKNKFIYTSKISDVLDDCFSEKNNLKKLLDILEIRYEGF